MQKSDLTPEQKREKRRLAAIEYRIKNKVAVNARASANYAANRERLKEKRRRYYLANKEEILQKSRERHKVAREKALANGHIPRKRVPLEEQIRKHREKNREYARAQRAANPEAHRAKMREYMRAKRATDLRFRISHCLRGQINSALRRMGGKKGDRTMNLCGCSLSFLIAHLESQFTRQMRWSNHGTFWHIDHIVPLAAFDLTLKEEQYRACHYSNLRPMKAVENQRKSASIPVCQPELLIRMLN